MENRPDINHDLDDFSLTRVPMSARYSWLSVATQRFGQLSCLSQFMVGALLGYGMTFKDAFLALTLGAVILEIVSIFVGIAGQREGMNTAMLARWTGFGRHGSSLLSLVVAISLVGWFAVQNAIFASGMQSLAGGLPFWGWAVACGLAITLVVTFGFSAMAWFAYVTVPAFLVLAGWSIASALTTHSLQSLINSDAPGPALSLTAGATMVAGSFIIGAVVTPDMSRFNRSAFDVVKQTVVSITFGEYLVGLIGVLLAHAVGSADVVKIIVTTTSFVGIIILVASTGKINDWNLYSASLGVVNFFQSVFDISVGRTTATLVIGACGTLLSLWGGLQQFTGFLIVLGVAIPPVGGIMIVDYFILRRQRTLLDRSAIRGAVPDASEAWNLAGLLSWAIGFLVGFYISVGIPSINALCAAGLSYWLIQGVLAPCYAKLTSRTPKGDGDIQTSTNSSFNKD